jgi:hypothetical protein
MGLFFPLLKYIKTQKTMVYLQKFLNYLGCILYGNLRRPTKRGLGFMNPCLTSHYVLSLPQMKGRGV